MADFGVASISRSRTTHTTSDNSSSDSSYRSSRSVPALIPTTPKSGSASASTSSSRQQAANRMISAADYQNQLVLSTADNPNPTPTPTTTARKPRGRPPGSKNKPKPPIVITRDVDVSTMKPAILEISAGADIIDNIINFSRRSNAGISVMSASGSVSSVTLRHPTANVPSLSLHGPFNLLSLTGSFLGDSPSNSTVRPTSPLPPPSFGVTLAGAQGQVFGGIVAGKVTAAGPVVVTAATFAIPTLHRLPMIEVAATDHHQLQDENKPSIAIAGVGPSDRHHHAPPAMTTVYGGAGGGVVSNPTPLNCQMPPDHVMHSWAPRPPY